MDIKPLGSTASRRGPADSFTGTVWQNPIIEAPAPARIRGAWVRFEPRARTAWHTHPLGQTLHVVSGIGRVQLWGGPIREIRPGRRWSDVARLMQAHVEDNGIDRSRLHRLHHLHQLGVAPRVIGVGAPGHRCTGLQVRRVPTDSTKNLS